MASGYAYECDKESWWTRRRRARRQVLERLEGDHSSPSKTSCEIAGVNEPRPDHEYVDSDFSENSSTLSSDDVNETIQGFDESDVNDFAEINSTSSSDENDNFEPDLKELLRDWAVRYKISHTALSALLSLLKSKHPELPKDARTLLSTPCSIATVAKCGGQYYHFGVAASVVTKLAKYEPGEVANLEEISLQINIDGLPLFKSTSAQLWPILGLIDNLHSASPFVIGLFFGNSKPTDVVEYLSPFINDITSLSESGVTYMGMNYPLRLNAVVCDAPARAFVKGTKNHSGYCSCERCTTHGTWLNKVTFPELHAPLRTDDQFAAMSDEDHHTGPSPLADLPLGMVSNFPLDYMHLVCLGVMRRLLSLWMRGPLKCRLSAREVQHISEAHCSLKVHVTREFARKPRSLRDLDRWKATEFRQFLLYTGPVVLAGRLPEAMYKNFLLLTVALRILLTPALCDVDTMIDYAQQLLVSFVEHFGKLYGQDMIVYNVHNLIHLADDARKYGCLDNISAFAFENYLGQMKKMIRKPSHPLQQIVSRLSENDVTGPKKKPELLLKREHWNGPVPQGLIADKQYKELHLSSVFLSTQLGDNCISILGNIAIIRNIIFSGKHHYIVYEEFASSHEFFTYPLVSKEVDICVVSNLKKSLHFSLVSDITCKVVLLPTTHTSENTEAVYIAFPLMHTSRTTL